MKIAELGLTEVDFEEYLRLQRVFPWLCPHIEEGAFIGFAKISSELTFENARQMLEHFRRYSDGRRVSIKSKERGWKIVSSNNLDDASIPELADLVESTGNVLYLGLYNGISAPRVNFDIGFGRNQDGTMSSVRACVPGHLKNKCYAWHGSDDKFVQIYALRDA